VSQGKDIYLKLERLQRLYKAGAIPRLHKHEVNPGLPKGSRDNYLYFILTCSLNFQRSSPKTWQSALATWKDKKTRFVFYPESVVDCDTQSLRQALMKYKLALQPNRHIEIWQRLSITFHTYFKDDPRNLFIKANYDAKEVLRIVQKDMKRDFPYLSGPKLSNYFMFILLEYSDLKSKLKNTHLISIIPDTHIMKATVKLGLVSEEEVNPYKVEQVWRKLLEDTEYSPIDFHSILWNWSRNGFEPKV